MSTLQQIHNELIVPVEVGYNKSMKNPQQIVPVEVDYN